MTPRPSTLLTGGSVVESAGGGPARRADVAVRDGVVVAVGRDLAGWADPGTEVVDCGGGVIFPGLVDGHCHPVMGLDLSGSADLSTCRTLDEVLATLSGHAAEHPAAEWLTGAGLDPNVFGGRPLDNADISGAVAHRPALVHLFDGHAAIATDAALAAAGLCAGQPGPPGVVVDGAGRPTGLLLEEAAVNAVTRLVPVAPQQVRVEQLQELLLHMAATGLTGAHVMDAKGDALELFAVLDAKDALPLRLHVAPWCRPDDEIEPLIALQSAGGRMWQVAGIKMFLDGTIDAGTAWLGEPDSLGESTRPGWEPALFADRLRRFDRAGIAVAVHAIGDAAVAAVLDCVESLPRRVDGPRHRIEHLETVPDAVIARVAALGVAASMQPRHATDYTRADGSDNWSTRLGPERAARGWRCADVARAGGMLVLGSDWPVAPFDARLTLLAALTRRPPADLRQPPVQPAQALTMVEALHACTTAPHWVSRSPGGVVAPGRLADLTVFGRDPRLVAAGDLPTLPVLRTIAGGRVRYRGE